MRPKLGSAEFYTVKSRQDFLDPAADFKPFGFVLLALLLELMKLRVRVGEALFALGQLLRKHVVFPAQLLDPVYRGLNPFVELFENVNRSRHSRKTSTFSLIFDKLPCQAA